MSVATGAGGSGPPGGRGGGGGGWRPPLGWPDGNDYPAWVEWCRKKGINPNRWREYLFEGMVLMAVSLKLM